MERKGIKLKVVEWIYLAQGGFKWPVLVNTLMSLLVPHSARSFSTGGGIVRFTKIIIVHGFSHV